MKLLVLFFICASCLVAKASKCQVSVGDTALVDHVMESFPIEDIDACYQRCHIKPGCLSINFYRSNSFCELNNGTAGNSPNKKVQNRDAVYFENPNAVPGKEFECWRLQPNTNSNWGYGGQADRISVALDRDVFLIGYRLWGVNSGTGTHTVTIKVEDSQTTRGIHSGSYTTTSAQRSFVVRFPKPVRLSRDVMYTFSALLSGPNTYSGNNGVPSKVCNGVTATFKTVSGSNGSSQSGGQIPAFIFA